MIAHWTFLTNFAHVLICIAEDPQLTLREIANSTGITERATHRIIKELEQEGAITHERIGRRNLYHVNTDFPLRHPMEQHCRVINLLKMVSAGRKRSSST